MVSRKFRGRCLLVSSSLLIMNVSACSDPEMPAVPASEQSTSQIAGREVETSARLDPDIEKMSLSQRKAEAARLVERAHSLMDEHDPDTAIEVATKAIACDPRSAGAYFYRGLARSRSVLGDEKQSIEDFQTAVKLDPDFPRAHVYLAELYGGSEQFEESIQAFSVAIAQKPDDKDNYRKRGLTYWSMGKRKEALADFDTYIKHAPDKSVGYLQRGKLLESLGRDREALSDYSRAADLEKGDFGITATEPFRLRALQLSRLGRHKEAIADLTEILKRDKTNDDALRNRGSEYRALKQYERAIDDYSKSIELFPEYARPGYEARAELYESIGKTDLARLDRQRASKIKTRPAEKPVYKFDQ